MGFSLVNFGCDITQAMGIGISKLQTKYEELLFRE